MGAPCRRPSPAGLGGPSGRAWCRSSHLGLRKRERQINAGSEQRAQGPARPRQAAVLQPSAPVLQESLQNVAGLGKSCWQGFPAQPRLGQIQRL